MNWGLRSWLAFDPTATVLTSRKQTKLVVRGGASSEDVPGRRFRPRFGSAEPRAWDD